MGYTTSTVHGIEVPDSSEANNIPEDIGKVVTALEGGSFARRLTGAQIAALTGAQETAGVVVYNTTTGKLQISNGAAWVDLDATAVAAQTTANAAQTTADAALPKAGGTMTGPINMGSDKITGLTKGTAAGEAMARQQVQSGRLASGAIYETGGMTITFATAFGATPNVVCQFEEGAYFANVHTVGTSSFKLTIYNSAAVQLPNYSSAPALQWIAVGN